MVDATQEPRASRVIVTAAAVGFGWLVWLLLPGMVVVIDDDFWYLKSVVETVQRGRPWTAEYLAPWAATTSSLAALVFNLTGSMTAAVHGQLALAAGLAFLAMQFWMSDHGVSRRWRWSLAVAVLTVPTVLFMFLMFTGVALYWACFWVCLLAFGRRRWGLFFLAWALAMANRQSAIVWLAFPGWHFLSDGWRARDWRSAWVLAGAAAWFLVLKHGMNANTAQQWVSETSFNLGQWRGRGPTVFLCLAAWMGGLGLGGLLKPENRPVNRWVVLSLGLAGMAVAMACLPMLDWTHRCYDDGWGKTFFAAAGALGGLGLAMGPRVPGLGASLAALGAGSLLILYTGSFDYYYVELVWLGVAGSLTGRPIPRAGAMSPGVPRWLAIIPLAVLLVANIRYMVRLKLDQHRVVAFNTLYERAYREGRLKLHETGVTTMGHAGWWLEDYYRAKTGNQRNDLVGFFRFCDTWDSKRGGVGLVTEFPRSFRKFSTWLPHRSSKLLSLPEASEIGSMRQRILGLWEATYRLKKISLDKPPGNKMEIDYTEYQPHPFPLDDAEWRAYIGASSKSWHPAPPPHVEQ